MKRIRCPQCRRFYALNGDGSIRRHGACKRVHESELPNGGEEQHGNHPSQPYVTIFRGSRARAGRPRHHT